MDPKDILRFCLDNGLLVDNEVLSLFSGASDAESVKLIIEKIKNHTGQRIITKNVFVKNKDQVNKFLLSLPEENQRKLEKLKINLGLSIEISKEISHETIDQEPEKNFSLKDTEDVRVISSENCITKKLEVKNFVDYFKNRFNELKNILQERSDLDNLVSINKISGGKQGISLIGLVFDKKVTKNKNILLEIEDLTGKISVLINQDNKELVKKAEDIALDSVIGVRGSGNREIFFASNIIFPDSILHERKKSPVEEYALFIGDLHFGSKKFLEDGFSKFIDYLNCKVPNTPEAKKIKYLFIVGDVVTGIGNYPNQERDLKILDLEEQFIQVANLFGKIRSDIKIIISPGNHDGVRIMEPQPLLDEKYAWPLYNLKNVTIVGNPSQVNIGVAKDFSGFNVLIYHGFSFPYYASNVPKLMIERSMNSPEKIMNYLLMNRHLAPTHASVQYFPSGKDIHFIKEVPDIFIAGHTHKSAVSYYNNILVISVSSWESMTAYQEKFGNTPDHCKVPMLNLKTRAVKILDFE